MPIDHIEPAAEMPAEPTHPEWKLIKCPPRWSEKQKRHRAFFQGVIGELSQANQFSRSTISSSQNWCVFSTGNARRFVYVASFAKELRVRVEVWLDCGDQAANEQVFDQLHRDKHAIEIEYGCPLDWERLPYLRACRIAIYRDVDVGDDVGEYSELRKWVIDRLLRFNAVFTERLRKCVK